MGIGPSGVLMSVATVPTSSTSHDRSLTQPIHFSMCFLSYRSFSTTRHYSMPSQSAYFISTRKMPVALQSSSYANASQLIFGAVFRPSLPICPRLPRNAAGNSSKQGKSGLSVLRMLLAWDAIFPMSSMSSHLEFRSRLAL